MKSGISANRCRVLADGCCLAFNKWVKAIKPVIERLSLSGLGALFRQNPWAAQRLAGFAGKTFCFHLIDGPSALPSHLSMRIARDGYLEAALGESHDLSLSLSFESGLVAQVVQQGPQALLSKLKLEGDVLLAAALGEVF
ncbi:MAG: SCP2 sterol-binding domain-containing protein, partial [Burkholderiaceae bacterium]